MLKGILVMYGVISDKDLVNFYVDKNRILGEGIVKVFKDIKVTNKDLEVQVC